MASVTRQRSIRKNDRATTEAIARETHTSVEEVQKLYEEELSELAVDAKITQYLGVLASKRVKMRLRKQ
jgi:DNA-directed RNA polymerase specialized sigma subunit